jgi:hypothetical protein
LTTILALCKAGVPPNPAVSTFIGREGDLLGASPFRKTGCLTEATR